MNRYTYCPTCQEYTLTTEHTCAHCQRVLVDLSACGKTQYEQKQTHTTNQGGEHAFTNRFEASEQARALLHV